MQDGICSNLYYSIEVAGVHVVMLGSYREFGSENRTPWLIVIVHAPWYTTNIDHQLEYASVGIKNAMEELIYEARVDAVFAGHVHSYERFVRFTLYLFL
ncbi:hypothetical protein MKW94_006856 [Papaver nudicaule]|uniref:Calcineurin-like phosphoesterase domain-containing protein n=1 Tax=Papaver nudicaule TaxID=74823 RepID=A0AA41RMC9_PAPNU|nr:hypothetical protein [Papaver nudicaule]